MIASVNAGKKGRRFKLSDFLLRWGTGRKKAQTPQEQLDVFRALARRQEERG